MVWPQPLRPGPVKQNLAKTPAPMYAAEIGAEARLVSGTRRSRAGLERAKSRRRKTPKLMAVIAIENVRLFDEIQDKSRQLAEASSENLKLADAIEEKLRSAGREGELAGLNLR